VYPETKGVPLEEMGKISLQSPKYFVSDHFPSKILSSEKVCCAANLDFVITYICLEERLEREENEEYEDDDDDLEAAPPQRTERTSLLAQRTNSYRASYAATHGHSQ
jgi:hypothetical protein